MTWQIQSKVRHQVLWRVHVTRSSSCFKIILTDKGIWFNNSFLHHEQLLDEDKDDMKNSADLGRCYPPKPKVSRQFPRVWTDVFSCKSEWHPSSGVPVYSCYLFESITWVSRPWSRAPRYRALRCQNSWAATWVSLRNVNRPIIVLLFTIGVNCKIMTKLSPIFQISRLVLTFYEELAGIIKPSKTEKYFERIIMLVYITWTFLHRFWSFVVEVPRRLQKVPAQRKNLYQRKSELLRLVSFWYSCSE